MNVLIIYAHPGENSFTSQIFEKLKIGLIEAGHQLQISDLYKMKFSPIMSDEEYEREGFANLNLPVKEDVKQEQQKLEKSDCVIFVYPVWWSDCPAILKGWFDRVYTAGFAYGYEENSPARMKKIKYGLVLCTAGHPYQFLKEIGIAESMKKVMINDRLGKRFENKKMIILGGTMELAKVEAKHLIKAYSLGRELGSLFTSN